MGLVFSQGNGRGGGGGGGREREKADEEGRVLTITLGMEESLGGGSWLFRKCVLPHFVLFFVVLLFSTGSPYCVYGVCVV